ncbi:aspartate-semialdehyde dehydrogenase [Candidatus Saccharibacteria bacterium]|nr:MAG: aspartate-semialdehyde dehydrogenase [Candidatus Saccharibacteria bacterium]
MTTYKTAVLGATGMVGQRFISLLENHPWFEVTTVAASPRSAGKPYSEAVGNRWAMSTPIPKNIASLNVLAVEDDLNTIVSSVDVVFCALDMEKDDIRRIEEAYAAAGVAVISNNSAHRWTADVPMIMPEVNPEHATLIETQRKNRGWSTGLIAVKPNCSIQSYVSVLTALTGFNPVDVRVTSLQAISGAGKTFATWPEMVDNVIPFIGGEEEKSEREPMKIWGKLAKDTVTLATSPTIHATCIRVPASDGHMASVSVTVASTPSKEDILTAVTNFVNPLAEMALPSAPKQLIEYFEAEDRPQTRLDRDRENGMGVSMGRLRQVGEQEWQFIALAHNTVRGAAGGAILMAELLAAKDYIHHTR